jgi:hypothetical protein
VRRLIPILLLAASPLLAQDADPGLPSLEVENVTIVGTRTVKLPPARKGEVVDSSVYLLPPKDTLLFGARLSGFGGPGGALPGYREFDRPAGGHAEASFGTHLSTRVMGHAEYNQRTFDLMGTVDFGATAGHVDSAEASSLLVDVHGGLLLGGDDPSAPRVRITAGFDRIGDNYFLYGTRVSPFDRSRTATRIDARLLSAQDALLDYGLYFHLEQTGVDDALPDTNTTATASIPGFGLSLAAGNDTLRGRLGVDYQIATLRYGRSQSTPNWVDAHLDFEWHPNPQLLLTVGGFYAGAQFSDSGSTTLMLPRVSARLQAAPALALYASYSPELRAPSYRNRIMRSPYVERTIVLRPELVPLSIAAGARLTGSATTLDARVLFETAENTPVVTADSAATGVLRYDHVDSRTLAIRGSVETRILSALGLLAEAEIRSAVETSSDEQLPMTPQIDVRLRGDYELGEALGLHATLRYESAQRVSLGDRRSDLAREIDARMLLDAGATLQFSPAIGLFAEATNLLGASYDLWDGYVAPGIELRAGARITF